MQGYFWERIESLFQKSLELAPEERASFLKAECGDDFGLLQEVESLLSHHLPGDSLMGIPLERAVEDVISDMEALAPGSHIDHFRIVRQLGQGGMGAVYLAVRDDDQYQQQVAIKIVRLGMDRQFVVRRFRTERQILANLKHPNIARLLDGGSTVEGLPYLVMEYIQGKPIDRYCIESGLSVAERLRLFCKACSAVQYAHQNLVIHRDIKPNNILVLADGEPKLLDFGIAKLLTPQQPSGAAELTQPMHQLMTPEFASPEQVRQEPVNTTCDVYSLGVLLYRPLTSRWPYRLKTHSPLEIQEAICKQEPEKPSAAIDRREPGNGPGNGEASSLQSRSRMRRRDGVTEKLRRQLTGDMDHILLKALRKEPHLRYSSVEQFADDIRRHLEERPVKARHGTFAYRSSKFIRRHKGWMAAAALFVITLAMGIVTTNIERAKAERRFNQVRKLSNSFIFDVEDEINKGPTKAKEMLVKTALEYLDSLAHDSGNDPSLQRELASAYERVGRIQGNSYDSNLGDTQGALVSYRKSLALRLQLASDHPKDPAIQNELANSYEGLGDVLYTADDLKDGLQNYDTALALRESLAQGNPKSPDLRFGLAELFSKIGDIKGLNGYPNLGDTLGALQNYRQSLSIDEDLSQAHLENREYRFALAKVLVSIGMLFEVSGDVRGALDTERRGMAMMENLATLEPTNPAYRMQLLASYATLRYVLFDNGEVREGLRYDRKTLTLLQAMSESDPQNTYLRRSLSVTYNSLGRGLLRRGDARGALEQHRKALAISESLSAADPSSGENWADIAFTLQRIGDTQAAMREFSQALDDYQKALTISLKMRSSNPTDAVTEDDVSISYQGIGKMLDALGDTAGALEAFGKAAPGFERISAQSPQNLRYREQLAEAYFDFGDAYLLRAGARQVSAADRASDQNKAKSYYQRSLQIWSDMQSRGVLSRDDAAYFAKTRHALARMNFPFTELHH